MSTIASGPIETAYAGYRFRSRLEARWAVFFDALGIEWKYEDQGFKHGLYSYLPDFLLPQQSICVEVKGDPQGLRNDCVRMSAFMGPDSPLPGFQFNDFDWDKPQFGGLLILGDLPNFRVSAYAAHQCAPVLHPIYGYHSELGTVRQWGLFGRTSSGANRFYGIGIGYGPWLCGCEPDTDFLSDPSSCAWTVETRTPALVSDPSSYQWCRPAYNAAKAARFEHECRDFRQARLVAGDRA